MLLLSLGSSACYLSLDISEGNLVLARIGSRFVVGRWHSCRCGDWVITDRVAIRITGRARILGSIVSCREFRREAPCLN